MKQVRLYAVIQILAVAVIWAFPAGASPSSPREITRSAESCEKSDFGPGDYRREITSGERKRSFKIHVPPTYTKEKRVPLVLNFHGGGGNADNQEDISQMNPVSDAKGFIVVYPNGTGVLNNRFLSFNAGMCCGYAKSNKVDDVGFARDLLDDVGRNFCIDPKKVYSTGFSNGAIMSHRLACELADRIAAIAPVSGPIGVDRCSPSRPVPVLEFHGKADKFAPYDGGDVKALIGGETNRYRSMNDTIAGWAERNGCAGTTEGDFEQGAVSCKVHRACKNNASVTLCTIERAGHTWPGGRTTLSEKTVGPLNKDIRASQMIWNFFEKHALP